MELNEFIVKWSSGDISCEPGILCKSSVCIEDLTVVEEILRA